MRLLVVGSDGLIGGALVPALRARGYTTVGTTRRPAKVVARRTVFLNLASDTPWSLPDADVTVIFQRLNSRPHT